MNELIGQQHHSLTQMNDSRPQKLTIGVVCCVESDVRVQNTRTLHLAIEKYGKTTSI